MAAAAAVAAAVPGGVTVAREAHMVGQCSLTLSNPS